MTNEQLRAELLPCPFCGESENLIVQHCEGTIIHPAYRIYCDNCGGSNGYTDRGDHVEDWNRRAALQTQDREDAECNGGCVLVPIEQRGEPLSALVALVNALRDRHYGRMPDEVQAAYDRAWSIVHAKAKIKVSGGSYE